MKLVIFGCGNISNRIAKAIKRIDEIDFVGFASKDIEKAKKYSELYECKEYGDYDYFLNSDVDAIYIATYNQSHYELIKRCLNKHKHVICEKPMLASIKELEELFSLAKTNNVLLMEALKSVFLPINMKIKNMIKNNELGEVLEAEACFMRNGNHPESHWINDLKTGGALKDLGSYCVGTLNYIFDIKPTLIEKNTDQTDSKADSTAYVKLKYDNVLANVKVSNSIDGDNHLLIETSRGYIKVNNFWKTGIGEYELDGIKYELNEECLNDFYYELVHFNKCIEDNILSSSIMNLDASRNILLITE